MVDDDGAKKWLAEHKGIPETGFLSSNLHVIETGIFSPDGGA
jgi:hypothetical protein